MSFDSDSHNLLCNKSKKEILAKVNNERHDPENTAYIHAYMIVSVVNRSKTSTTSITNRKSNNVYLLLVLVVLIHMMIILYYLLNYTYYFLLYYKLS